MKISILGFNYNVVRGYVEGKCEGSVDHIKQIIKLDSTLDFDNTIETLLHEVIHCIEYAMDLDLNDKDVTRISRGLYAVLEDPQNEEFWAALAGSDEIMEEEEGYVAFDADEVLENDFECDCDPGTCYNHPRVQSPVEERERTGGIAECEVENLSNAVGFPRWTDPEAERSRLSFADACRRKAEETGRVVVTTTEDYLPGQDY